jgi:hypothetical protein
MPSIEEMKSELIAAKYTVGQYRDFVMTPDSTPPLLRIEWTGSLTTGDYIEKAYAHMLKEREYEAMKAILSKIRHKETVADDYLCTLKVTLDELEFIRELQE